MAYFHIVPYVLCFLIIVVFQVLILAMQNWKNIIRLTKLFFKIKSNYHNDVVIHLNKKDVDVYDKIVHKLQKVALVETLEKILKDNELKTNDEIYDLLLDFVVYIENKMPNYLTCTKDNIRKYFTDWKRNDKSL